MAIRIDEAKILSDIEKLIRGRKRITSLTKYYYSTLDIYNLLYIYKELTGKSIEMTISNNSKFSRYMRKYMSMLETNVYFYFLNQEEHTSLSHNILKTFEDSNFIDYTRKLQTRFSEKEFLELARDFCGSYDNRLYKLLNSTLERNCIDMRGINKSKATTHAMVTSNNHYILMPNQFDLEGIVMLVHELGHLWAYSVLDVRSKKQSIDTNMTFYESYSHYMEQCFMKHLKNNHILPKETAIIENSYYVWLKEYFESLEMCKVLKFDEEDIDVLELISDSYQYSYGMLLGVLLHERYINDPINTKKDIDNYLFNQGLVDNDRQLEMLGLTRDGLKDTKVLSKRLKEHDEFYKKYS